MTVLVGLGALSVWAATRLEPGTFLPPLSWPLISSCIWLALLHLRPRLNAADKRQACAGLLASAMILLFLLQDGEFTGWGDVYYFCGSRMQYCTCGYRWNLAGWNKAIVLWGYVLTTTLGVQRLLVQLVLQGLLPGEEVVTKESFISICWRLIPYWLNAWEAAWGAECSSMTFELPQFAVELLIILPCVQILCSRMKVLAMPSVNAALPRGWDGASAEQIEEAFVPNVQRGCWERRPEQKHLQERLKANRPVTAFAALLCLLACFNSLYVPLHLEDVVLSHPRTAGMLAAGRLPTTWESTSDLSTLSNQLQDGSLHLTQSYVTQKAISKVAQGKRAGMWRISIMPDVRLSGSVSGRAAAKAGSPAAAAAPSGRYSSSFAAWVAAVEEGPWNNSTWAAEAVDGLRSGLNEYRKECSGVFPFQQNVWKHHYDIFRMQDPTHRVSIPLIEAALALMRLSTEKFFVLLSLYVSFLLFRVPPPQVAKLIGLNARISNAFARLVLYSFPCVCWLYGAGFTFSMLVSLVFWGGPLWQVYHGLRTHACTVTVKGLRPATAAEIERMHNDCAICWCPMTVPGAGRRHSISSAAPAVDDPSSTAAAREGAAAAATAAGNSSSGGGSASTQPAADAAGGVGDALASRGSADQQAQPIKGVVEPTAGGAVGRQSDDDAGDSVGSTLPCGHCYHQTCLTQWLQQCHGQGTTPTCPMCQARMQLTVKWHLWKALFAPTVWQLPARRRGNMPDEAAGPEQQAAAAAHNNYLLRHNPRLAELLADMHVFLAPENVQLLADLQELRWQRQQMANELQLRQQQLQRLEGRHQELEMRLELQRQQLLNELQLLGQQLVEHRQQQRRQREQAERIYQQLGLPPPAERVQARRLRLQQQAAAAQQQQQQHVVQQQPQQPATQAPRQVGAGSSSQQGRQLASGAMSAAAGTSASGGSRNDGTAGRSEQPPQTDAAQKCLQKCSISSLK